MKRKKLLGIFDRRPLIWFHYVLLTGVLFGAYYLGESLFNISSTSILVMAMWFFLFIGVGDQLIHKILGVD